MIQLETFTEKDFSTLIGWIDSREALMQFAGPLFLFPLTTYQLEIYCKEKNMYPYKIVDTVANIAIGHAEIVIPAKEVAVLCRILIGNPAHRNKGYGLLAVQQLLEICFTQLQAEKAELNVFDWNAGAIRCYEKAGFRINEGHQKTREVNGKLWTALNMTLGISQWNHTRQ